MERLALFFFLLCFLKTTLVHSQIINVRITPQYSVSNYSWSVAGNTNGNNPNVMSELTWRKVERYGASLDVQIKLAWFKPSLSFSGEKSFSGYANDVDYALDNRQGVKYNRFFKSDDGHFYRLRLTHPIGKIEGFGLGISFNDQKLTLKHDGDISSSYRPKSLGMIAMFSKNYVLGGNFFANMNHAIIVSRFFANASWKLREDLNQPVSFSQYAFMGEFASSLKIGYKLAKDLSISLGCELSRVQTTSGDDYLFFADDRTALTRFNGLESDTFRIGISIVQAFY